MTALQSIYTAAKAIMDDAAAAGGTTLTQAPTNYGTDFRITPGQGLYQVQLTPERVYRNSNLSYPRAIVTVRIHHYVNSLASEVAFLHDTLGEIADRFLISATWSAETGIYATQPDIEPEMDDGGRTGNVITFEASAVVLADPV